MVRMQRGWWLGALLCLGACTQHYPSKQDIAAVRTHHGMPTEGVDIKDLHCFDDGWGITCTYHLGQVEEGKRMIRLAGNAWEFSPPD